MFCLFAQDLEESPLPMKSPSPPLQTRQPTGLVRQKNPIFSTHNDISFIQDVEQKLNLKVTRFDRHKQSENKSRSVFTKMCEKGMIKKMIENYSEIMRMKSRLERRGPVFVFIGSIVDEDLLFACVLNQNGASVAVYYEKNHGPHSVKKIWGEVLNNFDAGGCIQSVVIFDQLYEYAKTNSCKVLGEGDPLENVWDGLLDQLYNSEIDYEDLGFGKSITNNQMTRASVPCFACIDEFDHCYRPHIFYNVKNEKVWHLSTTNLSLVVPKTGKVLRQYSIIRKNADFVIELITN